MEKQETKTLEELVQLTEDKLRPFYLKKKNKKENPVIQYEIGTTFSWQVESAFMHRTYPELMIKHEELSDIRERLEKERLELSKRLAENAEKQDALQAQLVPLLEEMSSKEQEVYVPILQKLDAERKRVFSEEQETKKKIKT